MNHVLPPPPSVYASIAMDIFTSAMASDDPAVAQTLADHLPPLINERPELVTLVGEALTGDDCTQRNGLAVLERLHIPVSAAVDITAQLHAPEHPEVRAAAARAAQVMARGGGDSARLVLALRARTQREGNRLILLQVYQALLAWGRPAVEAAELAGYRNSLAMLYRQAPVVPITHPPRFIGLLATLWRKITHADRISPPFAQGLFSWSALERYTALDRLLQRLQTPGDGLTREQATYLLPLLAQPGSWFPALDFAIQARTLTVLAHADQDAVSAVVHGLAPILVDERSAIREGPIRSQEEISRYRDEFTRTRLSDLAKACLMTLADRYGQGMTPPLLTALESTKITTAGKKVLMAILERIPDAARGAIPPLITTARNRDQDGSRLWALDWLFQLAAALSPPERQDLELLFLDPDPRVRRATLRLLMQPFLDARGHAHPPRETVVKQAARSLCERPCTHSYKDEKDEVALQAAICRFLSLIHPAALQRILKGEIFDDLRGILWRYFQEHPPTEPVPTPLTLGVIALMGSLGPEEADALLAGARTLLVAGADGSTLPPLLMGYAAALSHNGTALLPELLNRMQGLLHPRAPNKLAIARAMLLLTYPRFYAQPVAIRAPLHIVPPP